MTTCGHLICTFISENQGLEKLRSASNRMVYGINLKKNSGDKLKKIQVCWT